MMTWDIDRTVPAFAGVTFSIAGIGSEAKLDRSADGCPWHLKVFVNEARPGGPLLERIPRGILK